MRPDRPLPVRAHAFQKVRPNARPLYARSLCARSLCARSLRARSLCARSLRARPLCVRLLYRPFAKGCAPGFCLVRLRKAARSVTVFSARRFPLCACRSVFSAPTVRRRVCGKVRRRFAGGFRKFTGRWFWAGKAQNLRRGRGRGGKIRAGRGEERKKSALQIRISCKML